jgi:CRP/FNR family transcriptional regulator
MVINVFGSGDSFNEVPVIDELENPVNAEAVLETKIWLINVAALRYVIKTHPDAAQKMIINLSQNLRMLVHKVAELTFYTVTGRLARLLRELPDDQLSGPQRVTQDDLASRIGSVREVVARSLKELEDVGAIDLNRGEIKIIDQDILVDWE